MRSASVFLLLLLFSQRLGAQVTGIVTDVADNLPMANVSIENIFTRAGMVTDSTGKFSLAAEKGQLLEFRKIGFKTARVRIPEGAMPPFFKIVMEKGALELAEVEVHDRYRSFKNDSIRNYELFKQAIEFPTMTAMDMINHPFSALSKRNRQIWAFQKEYNYFEQEKFVDYAFNEKLVTNLTGLKGDSVQQYITAYRPSYGYLRSMKEYDFFSYIKETVAAWRRQQQGRGASSTGR